MIYLFYYQTIDNIGTEQTTVDYTTTTPQGNGRMLFVNQNQCRHTNIIIITNQTKFAIEENKLCGRTF